MSIRILTTAQQRDVLIRLVEFGRRVEQVEIAVTERSSLMVSFLMHQLGCAQAVLGLLRGFGEEWVPSTAAYPIVRTMFEVDVTAHYVSQDPESRSRRYIEFSHVLKKRRMDACSRHRSSPNESWKQGMESEWQSLWAGSETAVTAAYEQVRPHFESANAKGKTRAFSNWSGKTLYEMAVEVEHVEAYDLFYADLSSFTHSDVRLADRHAQQRTEAGRFEEVGDWRMRYLVVLEQGPSSFGAYVPDLPGCVVAAATREEALTLIREAIEFHIEGLKQEGQAVPPPSSTAEVVDVHAA